MAFIGIFTEPKNETYTRNILDKDFSSQHEKILFINNNNIKNIKNIRFETILFDTEKLIDESILNKLLSYSKCFVFNYDIDKNIEKYKKMDLQLVTFGFNPKSTVTISSVTDENILMCIQRKIYTMNNEEIEPQEIKIDINKNRKITPNTTLGVQILRIIYDKIWKKLTFLTFYVDKIKKT